MRMTAKRRAWLQKLAKHGPAESHSVVGYACRKAGWTEFVYYLDGAWLSSVEAKEKYGGLDWWNRVDHTTNSERITDEGRAALGKEKTDE